MAIYSTFFLYDPERLHSAFPDWKLPLPEPVTRTWINPFTQEETTIETRSPEWEDVDPTDIEMPEMQVVSINVDYESYLEGRIPPCVQSQPHWCAKNLTQMELEPLLNAITGTEDQKLETPLYAHPSLGTTIEQFPDAFLAWLEASDESSLPTVAQRWAAVMSTPEFTHSVGGERVVDDWTAEEAMSILKPLAELAKQHDNAQSMFVIVEG